MNIAQNIMTHFVLFKRKVVMDQLRKGLELMGVLDQIKNHPDFYSQLLTAASSFTSLQLIDTLCFEDNPTLVLVDNLKRFINQADAQTLKSVVRYVTGSIYLPRKSVSVTFSERNGFFVSTRSLKLECPLIECFKDFSSAFLSAISPSKAHFTSV